MLSCGRVIATLWRVPTLYEVLIARSKPLGRRHSAKIMAFLYPRLTPYLSGRLASYFATRARPESSATVEFRLPLILRARCVSTSRPKDAVDVKAVPHGE